MGRGQAVRHRVLVPLLGGSNPSVPELFPQNRRNLKNILFCVSISGGYNVIFFFLWVFNDCYIYIYNPLRRCFSQG